MRNNSEDAIKHFYEYCLKYKSLVIYGAGDVGRMVAEFMNEKGISFECFCVTQKVENNILEEHEIKEFDEAVCSDGETAFIVAVSHKSADGILKILAERDCSYFYSTEFLFQIFKDKCRISASKVHIQNGFIIRIDDIAFKQDTMYICCPASIGDTLYLAAFVEAYKRERNNGQKVCLILKKSHNELGALFPAVDEIFVSNEIVEILDLYSMYTQTWTLKNYLYGHFKKNLQFEYDSEYKREGYRGILPRYGKLILNLSENAGLADIICSADTIQPKKTLSDIVIMPYAQTAEMLPDTFWEELAGRLHEKGYTVYTNVGSEKEKAVQGTMAISESLMNTARFCEKCGAVISLRSGMCDLLGFIQVKLIVINTSTELSEEWNLNDVFGREEIYNIDCFKMVKYSEKIDEIMSVIG